MPGGRACYTTARVRGGEVLWLERHIGRLVGDAAALGLGALDASHLAELFRARAREAFGDGDGALRVEVREARRAGQGPELVVLPRGLGDDPPTWRAGCARTLHPGPGAAPGAKRADDEALHAARAEARAAGLDEVLLFDGGGFLVEGSRSAALVVLGPRIVTPPARRGGVASLSCAAALASCPEVEEADVRRAELTTADEIVCINALRGARPVVELDGVPLGSGRPGPFAARLRAALPEL